jgi:orotidine-5'-phosphate decarboxylase
MSRTIIALDFSGKEEVLNFLDQFKEPVWVKVGMELTYACGLDIIKEIKKRGHHIFLDLKLHDIPNTVKGGMKNLAKLGVDIVNCHASGGIEMMKAAKEGVLEGTPEGMTPPKVIAVTILTSVSKEAMNHELGIDGEVMDTVVRYAKNAKEAGLDGVVCSVHEARAIHEACGKDFLTVTPGIRLKGNSANDQKRVATPETALEEGCDLIVVGRSITKAEDPLAAYQTIEEVMEHGRV